MSQQSILPRFITAMIVSILFTGATFLPLLAIIGHAVSVTQAAPIAYTVPVPVSQVLSPPPAISGSYHDPESCFGNCSWTHDPSIVYKDETYWRFTTSGNIAVHTSRFLEGPWKYRGALLQNGTKIHLRDDQDIWAPSISKHGDLYYCHYSVSFIGAQHSEIGVATSPSLEIGSWTDHGAIGLPQDARYNLIDPYVFQADNNAPIYMTFGSYWSGIQQIELSSQDQLTSWAGTSQDIHNIISNTTENHAVQEGAIMYKNGEFFYMFFSVGQCCKTRTELVPAGDEYHVAVCRADEIAGPYFDNDGKDCLKDNGGTTILESHGDVYAPGGQGVMVDEMTDRTVMYYHYVKPSVGYEADQFFFGFNYLDWIEDWPVIV